MTTHEPSIGLTYSLAEMDLDAVAQFILDAYWGRSLTRDQIHKSFRGSACVGLISAGQQIGFGRAISDGATSAYLKDIIVFDAFQRCDFSCVTEYRSDWAPSSRSTCFGLQAYHAV